MRTDRSGEGETDKRTDGGTDGLTDGQRHDETNSHFS